MLFGRDLRLPENILFRRPLDASLASEEYVEKLQACIEEMYLLVRDIIDMASEKRKTRYNARATGHDFHKSDKMWLRNPKRRKGLSLKLQNNWEAPQRFLIELKALDCYMMSLQNLQPLSVSCDSFVQEPRAKLSTPGNRTLSLEKGLNIFFIL
ncbi:retrovirus-related Pol polyprotein from transposon 412 [Trichonephila clavipes]|nr:retrovirus-related Pol polyprotein from transposon 412 [Trichonephila clavipes]